jgi:predicted CXXCH cytochrome family protein
VVQPALHLAQGGPPGWPHAQQWLLENPGWLAERFWSDGQNRVRGREYNDIQASACFRGGELSCLSCHSMHDADPDKLVRADRSGDAGCLVCHAEYAAQIEAHAHHPPGSEGARCTNCHMPNTTYGMLGAQRSHTINSPDVASGQASGRPNACNLCHLDQTLAWTQQRLEAWYGVAPVELSRDEREIAASVLWLLRGDAGQRALVAWHMGWAPAQQASTADWLAAYLAESLIDPYAAVRYIGHHALMTLPGFEDVQYDYLAPRRARMAAASAVEQRWQQRAAATPLPPDRGARLLLDPAGIDRDRRAQLLRERDHRPIVLAE